MTSSHVSHSCTGGILLLNDPVLNREENWREWPLVQMLPIPTSVSVQEAIPASFTHFSIGYYVGILKLQPYLLYKDQVHVNMRTYHEVMATGHKFYLSAQVTAS